MTLDEARQLKVGDYIRVIKTNEIGHKQGVFYGDVLKVKQPIICDNIGVFYESLLNGDWFILFDWIEKC